MVKLEIKIEEKFNKNYETISASAVEVETKEIGIKATKREEEVTELLKKRIGSGNEVINKSKRKQTEDLKEFIDKLLNSI